MPSHAAVAASVRRDKERHPENYCPIRVCLWRTYDARTGTFVSCERHGLIHPSVSKGV